MPGPGGPGPAAERALAQRLDPRLMEQQVLVVAFPDGSSPEVHIAFADPTRRALAFCEAGVSNGGNVDLGSERLVALADIGSVHADTSIPCLNVMALDGQVLVQIIFEDDDSLQIWTQGLRAVIAEEQGADSDGGDDDTGMHMLQARSRQLQIKIGSLEDINERRDLQLNKMVRRLDGAMQMLGAVQDMCSQQRNVIQAQKVAMSELQRDLGIEIQGMNGDDKGHKGEANLHGSDSGSNDSPPRWPDSPPRAGQGMPYRPDTDSDDSPGGAGQEGDSAAQGEQMMALLAQAEQMQRMLQMLEGRGADNGAGPSGSPGGPAALAALLGSLGMNEASLQGQREPAVEIEEELEPDEDSEDDEDGQDGDGNPGSQDEAAALARLQSLEAEKQRFEGLLRDSQQEHQDLIEKLSSMRTLMSALGIEGGIGEDDDDDLGYEN